MLLPKPTVGLPGICENRLKEGDDSNLRNVNNSLGTGRLTSSPLHVQAISSSVETAAKQVKGRFMRALHGVRTACLTAPSKRLLGTQSQRPAKTKTCCLQEATKTQHHSRIPKWP